MSETVAEEVARLQREIAERQARLQLLVCGDPRISVTMMPVPFEPVILPDYPAMTRGRVY